MEILTLITIAGTGIGLIAGTVQVVEYLERRKHARVRAGGSAAAVAAPSPPPPAPAAVQTPAPPSPLPDGTVTFLITDIEGSSRRWEHEPTVMRQALARHNALLTHAIASHGGHVFKDTGDGLLAAFPTASDAVEAALDGQRALRSESWPGDAPLQVRMALHTGAAQARDGDYHGPVLNRLARLLSAGHGGQTLVSRAAYQLACDALPPQAALKDLGAARLRDLTRPEQVYQLTHPDLPRLFPALRSLETLPNNLPPEISSFVGREKEMAEVRALMDKTRLLTLTGMGGTGKTRLGLHVAADLLSGDGDGVWLIELAPVSDPTLVPQAVAGALGVPEQPGVPLGETLTAYLRDKCLLLLLDNCEHLLDACARLAEALLKSCPQVSLLATSREALSVPGERVYRVPSLALPDPRVPQTSHSLSQYEAVALFIDRALATAPHFVVTNENAPALAQVCARLDGIPLALELAAARVGTLSIDQIERRMGDRFRLLTGGARTALPRQQTLRAVIDWSYDLLSEPERLLLRRLSAFPDGWTLEAAEQVCADPPPAPGDESAPPPISIGEGDVLDLLSRLVDKSLVATDAGETAGGERRYRLLETLRQYSADKLYSDTAASESLGARLLAYYLSLGETAAGHLDGPDEAAWLDRLAAEQGNVRAALEWARERDPESCLRLSAAVYWFWFIRGYQSEWRGWLESALARGRDVSPGIRAKALTGAGILAWSQGDCDAARGHYQEALALQRQMGDRNGIASALNNLAILTSDGGDLQTARALYTESLGLYQETGSQGQAAKILCNLGLLASAEGDWDTAAAQFRESLTIFRQLRHRSDTGVVLENLGDVARRRGDLSAARRDLREALDIQWELGDRPRLAKILQALALVSGDSGEHAAAAYLLGFTETLRREMDMPPPPSERDEAEAAWAKLRQSLGEDRAAFHRAQGAEASLGDAVEAARDEGD